MHLIVTGAAGFVGSNIIRFFKEHYSDCEITAIDNLSRRGSENNIHQLKLLNVNFVHADVRNKEDIDDLPKADWIIDCAANPSVLAGLDGGSLGLVNNNLIGTINLLEKCKKDNAGFIMLSTSRVYSINELNNVPLTENGNGFEIQPSSSYPTGFSSLGVSETFSIASPISLYGATKLASEVLALEYHHTFGFPVWINRCGVIAGPGQFGKIDQGIFSYWIYQYLLNKPLAYIGFGGNGAQARDMIHPDDISKMLIMQIENPIKKTSRILNLGGGIKNTLSLKQLNQFCLENIGKKDIRSITDNRSFDIPLYATDYSLATKGWGWIPSISAGEILQQILSYAKGNLPLIEKL